jgi:hypothetical protein
MVDPLSPQDVSTLLARLNGLITDAQALQIDIEQKTIERRASDQSIPQPLGERRATELSNRSVERRRGERRRSVVAG